MQKKFAHEDEASREIISVAIEVHRQLGQGYLNQFMKIVPNMSSFYAAHPMIARDRFRLSTKVYLSGMGYVLIS